MVRRKFDYESTASVRVSSSRFDRVVMSSRDASREVVAVVRQGGLAVVHFDVSYAFLAGARRSLGRIYELKLRPLSRPCPILATWEDVRDVATEGEVSIKRVKSIADAGLPVGLLITPDWQSAVARSIPESCVDLLARDGRLALFINMGGMSDDLLRAAESAGVRLFGSSANISGKGNSFSLGDVPETMLEAVDIVCEAGRCKYANAERMASTIVDLETAEFARRGILHDEIAALLSDPRANSTNQSG